MLSQEQRTARCHNYLNMHVDATSRKAMVDWCMTVVDAFDLSRETVNVAFVILDRYLSSGRGSSAATLQCKQTFQKMSITCFYMAVKINEPVQLGMRMLLKLCRGIYSEREICAAECEILSALQWRVYLSATSPMEYVRRFLDLFPEHKAAHDVVCENAMLYLDAATSDVYFSTCLASHVAIACLAGALEDTWVLSSLEKDVLWNKLSAKLGFDVASPEVRQVEQELFSKSTGCQPRRPSRASLPRCSSAKSTGGQASSPVSVMMR